MATRKGWNLRGRYTFMGNGSRVRILQRRGTWRTIQSGNNSKQFPFPGSTPGDWLVGSFLGCLFLSPAGRRAVVVSLSHCNTSLQTWCLNTVASHSSGGRSLSSRCWWATPPLKARGQTPSFHFPAPGAAGAPQLQKHYPNLCLCVYMAPSLCVPLRGNSFSFLL